MPIYVICMKNSRGHNLLKKYSSTEPWQYAQLGLVSIIIVKLYWILTKGCREIVITRLQTDRLTNKPTDKCDSYIAPIYYESGGIKNSVIIHKMANLSCITIGPVEVENIQWTLHFQYKSCIGDWTNVKGVISDGCNGTVTFFLI